MRLFLLKNVLKSSNMKLLIKRLRRPFGRISAVASEPLHLNLFVAFEPFRVKLNFQSLNGRAAATSAWSRRLSLSSWCYQMDSLAGVGQQNDRKLPGRSMSDVAGAGAIRVLRWLQSTDDWSSIRWNLIAPEVYFPFRNYFSKEITFPSIFAVSSVWPFALKLSKGPFS